MRSHVDACIQLLKGLPVVLPHEGQLPDERPQPRPPLERHLRFTVRLLCFQGQFPGHSTAPAAARLVGVHDPARASAVVLPACTRVAHARWHAASRGPVRRAWFHRLRYGVGQQHTAAVLDRGGSPPMLTRVRPGASVLYVRATRASLLRAVRTRGAGQLAPRRHALYAHRTRTSLGRAVRTAYRGTLTLTLTLTLPITLTLTVWCTTGLYCTEIAADAISLLLLGTLPVRLYRLEARHDAQEAQQPAQQPQRRPPSAQHATPAVTAADAPAAARSRASDTDCCVVCLVEPKSHLITPCGHKCVCATCATRVAPAAGRVSTCPICRAKVESVVRVFD
eukprot:scaffold46557_cov70-Phaeocystis_antarctica.AAC.2